MAVQNPFFGKRDAEVFQPGNRAGQSSILGNSPATASSTLGGNASSAAPVVMPAANTSSESAGSKLTVGPNIKLKGVEITDCDTLVVEGIVEATMNSRVIQIAENGAFKGSADIDVAEIRGEFNGTLTVRQKLVIFSTGKVNGKIRYGKLVVEEGGQLAGEIVAGMVSNTSATVRPAPLLAIPEIMAA